jgi:hypothetical protein
MIEFDASYRKELAVRLPLIYFFAKKKIVDLDNYNCSTVIIDLSSDNPTRKRTTSFRKPITKIQL